MSRIDADQHQEGSAEMATAARIPGDGHRERKQDMISYYTNVLKLNENEAVKFFENFEEAEKEADEELTGLDRALGDLFSDR